VAIALSRTKWPDSWVEIGSVFSGRTVVVTSGLLKLPGEQVGAILAHEIAHVEEHLGMIRMQAFLSRLALMGQGYLVNVFNGYRLEFEADDWAVKYLEKSGLGRTVLANALRVIVDKRQELKTLHEVRKRLAIYRPEMAMGIGYSERVTVHPLQSLP